jgi:Holliday junction resolvasome RuvABC endonuclease subunit
VRILGCDPGAKGAFALIDTEANTLAVIDMPLEAGTKNREATSAAGVAAIMAAAKADAFFIEEVHSSPQMGVASAFSFGKALGIVHGAAYGRNVMLTPVRPQEWKSKTLTPKDKKEATRRASQLFPKARDIFYGPRGGAFDGRAEAAILAFYGCLFFKQVPTKPLQLIEFPNA